MSYVVFRPMKVTFIADFLRKDLHRFSVYFHIVLTSSDSMKRIFMIFIVVLPRTPSAVFWPPLVTTGR